MKFYESGAAFAQNMAVSVSKMEKSIEALYQASLKTAKDWLKYKQEVQADFERRTSLDYTPCDPAFKTTKPYVKGKFESRWGF